MYRRLRYLARRIQLFIRFRRNWYLFKRLNDGRFELNHKDNVIMYNDISTNTDFDSHYVYHPAWAARILEKTHPDYHVDISSTLNFCAIISAFIPVRFYDYRPANISLSNLQTDRADLLKLHFEDNSITSLSCMHTVEHVGLGRYGDPIDPSGDLIAINELKRVLAPGGSLLFVVPVGKKKLMYNSQRVYSYEMILEYFSDLKLQEFYFIQSNCNLKPLMNPTKAELSSIENGCGCFWFKK